MADKGDAATNASVTDPSNTKDNLPKAVIKNVDMSEEMQQEIVDISSTALERFNIEKDIAAQIKKECDRRFGPTWHVVVGKNFGSYVTHDEAFHLLLYGSTGSSYMEILNKNDPNFSFRNKQRSKLMTIDEHREKSVENRFGDG